MKTHSLLRGSAGMVLCLALAIPSSSQSFGNIGPSKGEVIAAAIGVGAVIGVVVYVVYHETHKHPTITGCVGSGAGGKTLTAQKNKRVYALSGDLSAVKDGEEVAVKGKKSKGAGGELLFRVERVSKDLGVCQP